MLTWRSIRRSVAVAFGLLGVSLTLSSTARADDESPAGNVADNGPHRQGFTLELGLGFAGTSAAYAANGSQTNYGGGGLGLSGLSLSLGGYVSPDFAIVARAAGTSFWSDYGQGTKQIVNGVYGVSAIGWLGDFFLSGGPGLALFVPTGDNVNALKGFGLDLRAGYAFLDTKHNALTLGLETTPAFYSGATVIGLAANLEWHYF
jgi:hypothetical protein